jgi:hypothetical protein
MLTRYFYPQKNIRATMLLRVPFVMSFLGRETAILLPLFGPEFIKTRRLVLVAWCGFSATLARCAIAVD